MRRLLFCISYDGSAYHGWQVQQNGLTVQKVVQDAIEQATGQRNDIVACSRTDAGVHANNFFFHMDIELDITLYNMRRAVNSYLPLDIAIKSVSEVDLSFHARYSAKSKEYVYKIWNSEIKDPFLKNLVWHYYRSLDLNKIKLAAKELIGEYNFTSFCSINSNVKNKVRTLYDIDILQNGYMVMFKLIGNGFLHNMVRIIVGTLVNVSEGLIDPMDMRKIIYKKDRQAAGKTAPASGLYLNNVFY